MRIGIILIWSLLVGKEVKMSRLLISVPSENVVEEIAQLLHNNASASQCEALSHRELKSGRV